MSYSSEKGTDGDLIVVSWKNKREEVADRREQPFVVDLKREKTRRCFRAYRGPGERRPTEPFKPT
ncbi:MAG: hypothetical protein CMJ81_05755 [Planctomycetaceae bacterium]|nr:hypothetical protein [Planctomycetaceae bacterium]MBP61994.1 hypothetical protein [Planctomycetaceae bacterium]